MGVEGWRGFYHWLNTQSLFIHKLRRRTCVEVDNYNTENMVFVGRKCGTNLREMGQRGNNFRIHKTFVFKECGNPKIPTLRPDLNNTEEPGRKLIDNKSKLQIQTL